MANVLLIPIVVSLVTVGLVGLTNGKYNELDGKILRDVFSQSWFHLLQESFSKLDKKLDLPKSSIPKFARNLYEKNDKKKFTTVYQNITLISVDFHLFSKKMINVDDQVVTNLIRLVFNKFKKHAKLYGLSILRSFGTGILVGGILFI
jgi:hypothetical protein